MDHANNQTSTNYLSLVQMLMNQITPQTRKKILQKLTDMNNALLEEESKLHMDKNETHKLIRKNTTPIYQDHPEIQHPSNLFNHYNIPRSQTETFSPPVNTRISQKFDFNPESISPPVNTRNPQNNQFTKLPMDEGGMNIFSDQFTRLKAPINANNILNDPRIRNPDSIDIKLEKIKRLHSKIITERKSRRRDKSS